MKLKFIGMDGSMKLQYGKVYQVSFKNDNKYIILIIKTGLFSEIICPYGSPQAVAKNWSL